MLNNMVVEKLWNCRFPCAADRYSKQECRLLLVRAVPIDSEHQRDAPWFTFSYLSQGFCSVIILLF